MPNQLIELFNLVALVIWGYVSVWFLVALVVKRNDVADLAWGLGFAAASFTGLIKTQNHSFTAILVTVLVLIWGMRLSWHIGLRNSKKPEDYRYKAWRDSWGKWLVVRSYFQIFLLQGFFMWLIVSPVLIIDIYSKNGIFPLVVLGSLLWLAGFLFESIGDRQLREFINKPGNKGRIMDKGLWKYSRHPNYFGEIIQWWAIAVMALAFNYGWLGLAGPLVITFLIIKVSGVALLEAKYATNPEYQAYKLRTNMLVPLATKK